MLRSTPMLDRTPLTLTDTLSHLSRSGRPLAVAAAAALALSTTGCGAVVDGTHDITMDFPVQPVNGTFPSAGSEVTLSGEHRLA